MTSIPRHFAIPALAAALALAAPPSPAGAGVPNPVTSTVQNVVVGSWDGHSILTAATPCGVIHAESFFVVVRDVASTPVGGAVVQLDFTGSGIAVSAAQNPGVTVSCVNHSIFFTADASGVAKFTPRFGGYNTSPSVKVLASGVPLASIPAISSDFDGDGRITLLDFTTFAGDYLGTPIMARSDFDNCPTTRLNDLTWMAGQYLASQGVQLAPLCP